MIHNRRYTFDITFNFLLQPAVDYVDIIAHQITAESEVATLLQGKGEAADKYSYKVLF